MAWPSTGITTGKPRNSGSEPINSSAATIKPHSAMVTGFADDRAHRGQHGDRRADVAVEQQRERHDADHQRHDGEQKPTPLPTMISFQPADVVNRSLDELADRRRRRVAEKAT